MTPEQRDAVIRLYVDEGWGTTKVARHLGLGDKPVRRVLNDLGVMRSREDYADISERIGAARAKMPLEEFKRRVAKGLKHCTPCSRDAGEPVWHSASAMGSDQRRAGHNSGSCLEQRRKRNGRCMDKRNGCGVRWGKHQHRHCPESLRVMEDGTVYPCNQPMVLDADRCATCESLLLLQERIAQLEAELQARSGRRLPSLVDDPRDRIPEAI